MTHEAKKLCFRNRTGDTVWAGATGHWRRLEALDGPHSRGC